MTLNQKKKRYLIGKKKNLDARFILGDKPQTYTRRDFF